MMLRGEVLGVGADNVVFVRIPQKYGRDSVRAVARIQVEAGDLVYVTDTSTSRVPQWVVFDKLNEVGAWGDPYPHEHPIGQVVGLSDWLSNNQKVLGDHNKRMSQAEEKLSEASAAITQSRLDMAQVEQGLADARDRVAAAEGVVSTMDARVSTAVAQHGEVVDRIGQAERDVKAAGTRIGETQDALASVEERVESAKTRAEATAEQLGAVDRRLSEGQAEAASQIVTLGDRLSAARTDLDDARGGLSALSGRVDTVEAAAASADSKAVGAQSGADSAISTANGARAAADAAGVAARDAAGVAASKGEVIYQAAAPTGSRAASQNLWIRTSDNRPHTWDGSKWVAVTDKTARDAAAAAATAKTAADKASLDAQSAVRAAGNAQSTADGKSTTTVAATPGKPPWSGKAAGDMHYVTTGNTITEWWRWDGAAWVSAPLGSEAVANLDVGKLTGVFADFNQYIRAGSVLADRVSVGSGQNLIPWAVVLAGEVGPHGDGESTGVVRRVGAAGTSPAHLVFSDTTPGGSWRQVGQLGSGGQHSNGGGQDFPVTPGRTLRFSAGVRAAEGAPEFRVGVYFRKPDGGYLSGVFGPKQALTGSTGHYTAEVTVPDAAASAYLRLWLDRPGAVGVVDPDLRELTDGSLVVNGAISGRHVDARSVAAEVGQFIKVQAENVEVTDTLAARVVEAMTTTTKNLVVTESAVLQHATLLGSTVAEDLNVTKRLVGRDAILDGTLDVAQLNVTNELSAAVVNAMDLSAKKLIVSEEAVLQHTTLLGNTVAEQLNVTGRLVGRDAILTGTVDVGQLNVTGDMSAEIAKFMDATAKRLIVTEDALLNRVKVIEDIVTESLIAKRVDARYLRAGEIYTGLLEVTGRFRTAPPGLPQIIVQPSQAAWNNMDLAIWFTPDGSLPGAGGGKAEVAGGMWMNPTAAANVGTWQPQTLNLRGQSRAGVQIMDGLTLHATVGSVGPTLSSTGGQFLNIIGGSGVSMTSLDGDARITPYGAVNISARNGGVHIESSGAPEVRIHGGSSGGVRFTNQGGNATWSYSITTSSAPNMNMDGNGKLFKTTSSRRYKKDITDWGFDITRVRDVQLRQWRDRKQPGAPEDPRVHHGAIAEEIADLFPEVVVTIPDPSMVDEDGQPLPDAPRIPDSIEYDRLALAAAVAGWQDADKRLRALEERLG